MPVWTWLDKNMDDKINARARVIDSIREVKKGPWSSKENGCVYIGEINRALRKISSLFSCCFLYRQKHRKKYGIYLIITNKLGFLVEPRN